MSLLKVPPPSAATLIAMTDEEWQCDAQQRFEPHVLAWFKSLGYIGGANTWCPIADAAGNASHFATGCIAQPLFALAHLPAVLPLQAYRLECNWSPADRQQAALGWLLACYRFDRYRSKAPPIAQLWPGEGVDVDAAVQQAAVIAKVRDLINTAPADMMPQDLSREAEEIAIQYGAIYRDIVGDRLITANFPAIHSVGRASAHAPRLIELRWQKRGSGDSTDQPLLTLIGKGVCFDSGGLNIKSSNSMRLMKKDMGGAAHALGLAMMIMQAHLPVRLRVLIAAVDNAISGDAYRPGDVLMTRSGSSVEVDNTDAEGRIVLADALTAAVEERPDLVVDFATLTGAARVALGAELPALFCNNDGIAADILDHAERVCDPLWRMPLYAPYRDLLNSNVADLCNNAPSSHAGAITAALFLQHFVTTKTAWVHIDLMAWNTKSRPGRPEGGEAMGLRALASYLQQRYPPKAIARGDSAHV